MQKEISITRIVLSGRYGVIPENGLVFKTEGEARAHIYGVLRPVIMEYVAEGYEADVLVLAERMSDATLMEWAAAEGLLVEEKDESVLPNAGSETELRLEIGEDWYDFKLTREEIPLTEEEIEDIVGAYKYQQKERQLFISQRPSLPFPSQNVDSKAKMECLTAARKGEER